MSQENLKRFNEAASRDESLKGKLAAIANRHGGQELDESQLYAVWEDEVLPLARSKGYDFTLEDVRELQAAKSVRVNQLTDDELNAIVGGVNPYQCYCIAGGGGAADDAGEHTCICVLYGVGKDENGNKRCTCQFGGMGLD